MVSRKLPLLRQLLMGICMFMQSACNVSYGRPLYLPLTLEEPQTATFTVASDFVGVSAATQAVDAPSKSSVVPLDTVNRRAGADQWHASSRKGKSSNELLLLMRKVLHRLATVSRMDGGAEESAVAAIEIRQQPSGDDILKGQVAVERTRNITAVEVRMLWEKVTGQSFPVDELALAGLKYNRRGLTVGDDVAQAQKRLVPGGPDPLHHSSEPLSP
ncbi:hypothetical protein GOP47_0006394 [Adiantum capillus-veneris]|uniref:Lipoprotein n=1 Tax=Adiantum capillus-veneris TaxID=13818 RepID=A0A9D4V3S4_ADICA|nr:hypothetical protein GOP47_0006394 [Adiantum capillus-veneris]